MKNQEPSKLSAVRKLIPFLTLLFATFCFVPGQSQVVKVTKTVTKTDINGDSKTTTSVTLPDSMMMSIGNNMSGNQASNVLDSISITADKIIPILKKLEKSDPNQNGELLDELFATMNIKVNNRIVTHNDLSKEVLASLKPADYIEMENFLNSAKESGEEFNRQPQGQDTKKTIASMDLLQQFGKLGIVQKLTPDVVKLLGSMMNEIMQGMATQFNGMQLTSSGRLFNDELQGNLSSTTSTIARESKPDPVPVYVNPYCKLSDELFEWSKEPFGKERLVSIERKSSETVVTLSIPIYLNQWIRFSNKFQLINKKNGDRFNIRRVENMPLNTEIFFHDVAGRMVLAKVIFPPLKHNVKIVDLVDSSDTNEYESEWSFKDIKIADYKPAADKISSGSYAKVYY